jgi:hypothetical protein
MSREKQIEEMRNDLCEAEQEFSKFCRGRRCQECEYYFAKTDCKNQILAEKIIDKGYRKASDVAREIFGMLREDLKGEVDMEYLERLLTIYEKKYTEEGK